MENFYTTKELESSLGTPASGMIPLAASHSN